MYNFELDNYRDGGTIVWGTKTKFYLDRRIQTETRDEIYDEHPNNKGVIVEDLREARKEYENVKEYVKVMNYQLNEIGKVISDNSLLKDSINTEIIDYYHHNSKVYTIRDYWGIHRKCCLCNLCNKFIPEDREKNCDIANKLYEICVQENLCTPVTECPKFEEKKKCGQ